MDDVGRLFLRNLLAVREERLYVKDLESRFLIVSDGWLEAMGPGLRLEDVVGKTDFDFFTRPHAAAALEDERRIIATGEPIVAKIERETFKDRPDAWVSTSRWPLCDLEGRTIGTFGVSRDVTAQMLDPATGLANRLALTDRLCQALVALERHPGCIGLLFLDVDGFKAINDTWGHRTGDLVLAAVGARLQECARRFDTVARYGGDEFVVLLPALRDDAALLQVADRVVSALAKPVCAGEATLHVTASIGGLLASDPRADPEALLGGADRAMYAAKRAGGSRLVFDGSPSSPG